MKLAITGFLFAFVAICGVFGASPNRHSKKAHREVRDEIPQPCTNPQFGCPPCDCSTSSNPSVFSEVGTTFPPVGPRAAAHHKKSSHKNGHAKKKHSVRDNDPSSSTPIPFGPGPVCPPCNCGSTGDTLITEQPVFPPVEQQPQTQPQPQPGPQPQTEPQPPGGKRHHSRRAHHFAKHHTLKRHHN